MINRFFYHSTFILMALCFLCLPPSYADETGNNEKLSNETFLMRGEDLKAICEKDSHKCILWIEGVIEGMEFARMIAVPREYSERNIFCFSADDDYLEDIRQNFMEEVTSGDDLAALDVPAIIILTPMFQKYLCR